MYINIYVSVYAYTHAVEIQELPSRAILMMDMRFDEGPILWLRL